MTSHLKRDRDVSAARITFGRTRPKRCGRDMALGIGHWKGWRLKDMKDFKI